MACAKKGNLPHFLPLLGKILVLRVLPAYRKKIGCFPLNPPAPAARGGYKFLAYNRIVCWGLMMNFDRSTDLKVLEGSLRL